MAKVETMDEEPIVPMSDAEIEAVETNPNCPECGGDGADLEDSSKDCWACGGDGTMSSYRRRNPILGADGKPWGKLRDDEDELPQGVRYEND